MARQLEPQPARTRHRRVMEQLPAVRGLKRAECNCAKEGVHTQEQVLIYTRTSGNPYSCIYESQSVLVQCFTRPQQRRIANAD